MEMEMEMEMEMAMAMEMEMGIGIFPDLARNLAKKTMRRPLLLPL